MLTNKKTYKDLENQRSCLYADLYQNCGQMSVDALERLCREIHGIEIRLHSFNGGLYDK